MKTIPVAYVGSAGTQNAVLRWQITQIMNKTKGLVAIIPKQKQKTIEELIAEKLEKDNEEVLEKLIQYSKNLFDSES